jgi:hypothetical protein
MKSFLSSMPAHDRAEFETLAARLQFDKEEAARWLLRASVEALKDEPEIIWPLFLQQK